MPWACRFAKLKEKRVSINEYNIEREKIVCDALAMAKGAPKPAAQKPQKSSGNVLALGLKGMLV